MKFILDLIKKRFANQPVHDDILDAILGIPSHRTGNEVLTDNRTVALPFPASTQVLKGNLLYWDSSAKVCKNASARTDLGSVALNQRDFAQNFMGFMSDQRISTETSTGNDSRRLVTVDGIFDYDCTSSTFEVGDLIAVDRSATPANYDAQVIKVSNPCLAIGTVARREPVAVTRVRCRLTSRLFFGLPFNMNLGMGGQQGQSGTVLTDGAQVLDPSTNPVISMVPTSARNVKLPVEAQSAGLVFMFTNNSGGANTVTFQTSAAGSIKGNGAVPQNKTGIFWYDTGAASWTGLVSA